SIELSLLDSSRNGQEQSRAGCAPCAHERSMMPKYDLWTTLIARCDALVAKQTTAAIAQYGYYRGHPVVVLEGEACERYADGLTPTVDAQGVGIERPCVQCGMVATPDGPDPCLGMLPGVVSACCGHGVEEPYLKFRLCHDRDAGLRGDAALHYFRAHGVGP